MRLDLEDTGFSEQDLVAYIPALQAFSRSFARNRYDAEDLVQETVSRALANQHLFRRGTRLKSWLFTIMRNVFYNELHRTKRERPGVDLCVGDCRSIDPPQEWAVRLREVESAMQSVPTEFISALTLVSQGESCEEAAAMCACAVGTIKSRASRARRLILAGLGELRPD
jgi:RNA polymerase sigma factor (sigma-70 family)